MNLDGRVGIVTGAAQGLGKAFALALADAGARVVIADIKPGGPVRNAIEEKGGQALDIIVNVSDEGMVNEMASKTIERFGRIDFLINNAALFSEIARKPFMEVSGDEWDEAMRINLKGPFLCCKAVYPHMKKDGYGKIVNISSGTFFEGLPYFIHYVTSKGGIIGFTRALSRELGGDGICVNAIAPGSTLTEALEKQLEKNPGLAKRLEVLVAGRCFKRYERPLDLVGALLFLCSSHSDYITGQTLVVDGGLVFH
jgi:NAD(P)-dependent dehydrogenase (short-subunit alcohol dehydrogenase family)